ncbi:MAG: NAD(+)--dinitrogen-reductase ADP-D-ribosyltransferase [Puniceicoccales bacterium]|nr:NAD(+)--dinitrogen-reductase ADP-D-ribosyltransferase [Puniceicoccales bacterium]
MSPDISETLSEQQRNESDAQRLMIFNRCNLPPWVIGSVEFQDDPQPLEIDGVRMTDRRLFERLAALDDPEERGRNFHDYVSVKFRLHEWEQYNASARDSLRHSYIQLLHGWSADSNGRAGAVLKGWVESRFGLRATFHCGRLAEDSEARERYWADRMQGAARMMGVSMQLDLLYTFCQNELRRRYGPDERWVTLYRGTHDPDEYTLKGSSGPGRTVVLNCLSSFSSDSEVAWEFGSRVWEVRVPLSKVFFFSGLLPSWLLGGESEWLVLGGEYRVKTLQW